MRRIGSTLLVPALLVLATACAGPAERGDRWRPRSADEVAPRLAPGAAAPRSAPPAESTAPRVRGGTLELDTLLRSVEHHFPELLAAAQEIEQAEGLLLEAEGGFDAVVSGKGVLERGFFETVDFDLQVEQPIPVGGATLFSGYRIGRGNFASYDGDIITNDGGEFRLGAVLPLLQNRAIDPRRAAVWRARLERDAAEPTVQKKRVSIAHKASLSYWKWVSAGQKLDVARGLLALAENRMAGFRRQVDEGKRKAIDLTDNERLIVQRRGFVIAAERELERSAILLSLYLRDAKGDPVRPEAKQLPRVFPEPPPLRTLDLDRHIVFGLRHRPELAILGAERAQMKLDTELGENQLLPEFDLSAIVAQDVGGSSSSTGSLDPLKTIVGVTMKVPLQRRKARGKLQQARAKLAKVGQKIRLQGDQIENEVRDAASAFHRARERVALARRDLELTIRMEEAERFALDQGASDLLRLNLREQSTARARSKLIEVEATCFGALADYRAALGLPRPDIAVLP